MERTNVRKKGVANNQISCHSKLDLESSTLAVLASKTINDMRGRSRIKYGMTSLFNNGGFTLIELLVVVLIIGILGAIALPQYQRAVLKSRIGSVMPLAKALRDSNEIHYMDHGSYSDDLSQMDVTATQDTHNSSATLSDGTTVALGTDDKHNYVMLGKTNLPNHYIMYQKHSKYFPGEIHCEAEKENEQANWLCQEGLQGRFLTERALTNNYNTYVLEGTGNGAFPMTQINASEEVLEPGDSCLSTRGSTSNSAEAGCWKVEITDGECMGSGGFTYLSCNDSIFHNSLCVGTVSGCYNSTFDNSTCEGNLDYACGGENAIFENNSICNGIGWAACMQATFTDSTCNSVNVNSCVGNTYTRSKCYGEGQWGCSSSTYTDHSVCYALRVGSCRLSTYDATSYCDGSFCLSGEPSSDPTKKWYRGSGEDWPDDRPSELVNK